MADTNAALAACRALVDAYKRSEGSGGSVDWSDVDLAHELALKALVPDEPLMVPMVHMNGDSKGTLMAQCEDAHRAATAFIDALGEMSPNGRNFYTRGPDAILVALRQNVARVAKVMSVKTEIEAIWEAINEQNGR